MAGSSREVKAAQRAEKLKAIEAKKPHNERLLNREWNDHVVKTVSVSLLHTIEAIKHNVITTFCMDDVQVCESVEEAELYFKPNGTPWTIRVLKQFLETWALVGDGRIKDVLSVWTMTNKVMAIISAARYYGNPLHKDVKRNIILWLHTNLKHRGLVHDDRLVKVTPMPTDITSLLRTFFDPHYLTAATKSTRVALNVALCLGLMIDCNSRISELLDTNDVPIASRPAYWKQRENKIFTWRRVELFVFKDKKMGDSIELQARLTFHKLKRSDNNINGTRQKTIPLRLLPLKLAAEDTLRWLINLGLMDGVYQDIKKWEDFEEVPDHPDGFKIEVKSEFLDVPILRCPTYHQTKRSREQSLLPMTANNFRRELELLSRHSGLQYKLLPGCLRRAGAYILSLHATEEERCARMGHSDSDRTYFASYRNQTSTIDFQAMRHDLPAENVARMSSVTLGRLQNPPTHVSAEGQLLVARDSILLANIQEQCDVGDMLLLRYPALTDDVQKLKDPLSARLKQLKTKYAERYGQLMKKQFQAEYNAHFVKTTQSTAVAKPLIVPELSVEGHSEVLENLLDDMEQMDDRTQNGLKNIDPELLALDEREDLLDDRPTVSLLDDLAGTKFTEDPSLDTVQEDDEEEEEKQEKEAVKDIQTIGERDRRSRRNKYRFTLRPTGRLTLYNGIGDLLYDQPEDLTAVSFSAAAISMFNHNHVADRFYPNQEPIAGTSECRFCGEELHLSADSARHAFWCEANAVQRDVLEKLQQTYPEVSLTAVCSVTRHADNKPCSRRNGEEEKTKSSKATKFTSHARNVHFDRTTSKYVCAGHSFECSDGADFRMHCIQLHGLSTQLLSNDSGILIPGALIFWCKICEAYIRRTESTEDAHFATHFDEIQDIMAPHGLAGLEFSHKWLYPPFCPFCLYDADLPLPVRLADKNPKTKFMDHVETHLAKLKDNVQYACPASISSKDGIQAICPKTETMTKEELIKHMETAHGMMFAIKKNKRVVEEVEPGMNDTAQQEKTKIKKQTTQEARTPLGKKDANRQLGG